MNYRKDLDLMEAGLEFSEAMMELLIAIIQMVEMFLLLGEIQRDEKLKAKAEENLEKLRQFAIELKKENADNQKITQALTLQIFSVIEMLQSAGIKPQNNFASRLAEFRKLQQPGPAKKRGFGR